MCFLQARAEFLFFFTAINKGNWKLFINKGMVLFVGIML